MKSSYGGGSTSCVSASGAAVALLLLVLMQVQARVRPRTCRPGCPSQAGASGGHEWVKCVGLQGSSATVGDLIADVTLSWWRAVTVRRGSARAALV